MFRDTSSRTQSFGTHKVHNLGNTRARHSIFKDTSPGTGSQRFGLGTIAKGRGQRGLGHFRPFGTHFWDTEEGQEHRGSVVGQTLWDMGLFGTRGKGTGTQS